MVYPDSGNVRLLIMEMEKSPSHRRERDARNDFAPEEKWRLERRRARCGLVTANRVPGEKSLLLVQLKVHTANLFWPAAL